MMTAVTTEQAAQAALPYGGDVQAAQIAGDRHAIREIFQSRMRQEGVEPEEAGAGPGPGVDAADAGAGTGVQEDVTLTMLAAEMEHQRRVRSRQLLCLLLIMPTLLMFLVFTSQAAQQQAIAAHQHNSSSLQQQSPWFVNDDGDIEYDRKRSSYGTNYGNNYNHRTAQVHHTKEEDAESWWYFVGFSCLIMGIAHGQGSTFHVGAGVMLATAARSSYMTDHNTTSAIFFGVLSFVSFWMAVKLGCVVPARQRQEQEENTNRAIDQGLKTIIYRKGTNSAVTAAESNARNAALGTVDDDEIEQEMNSTSTSKGFLDRATRSAQQQYARVLSIVAPEDEEKENELDNLECGVCADPEEEEEEEEECPICLEIFKDGEELAASGCGHYFHPACVEQWVQVDSSEHHSQMRCPVCRFDVLEGIGAPTPAQIKHMRPGAGASADVTAVPTLQPIDNGLLVVDLEAGSNNTQQPATTNSSVWGRIFGSRNSTMQPTLQRNVATSTETANAL